MGRDLRQEVIGLLEDYILRHPEEEAGCGRLAMQARSGADLFARSNRTGHVTTSAVVLDGECRRALLIHHRALGLWLSPGGHYEPPGSLWESACREVAEETGVTGLAAVPGFPVPHLLDIDTHAIPARPARGEGAHRHHDFAFLAMAPARVVLVPQAEEVHAVRWVPVGELQQSPDERVRRVGRKLQRLFPV